MALAAALHHSRDVGPRDVQRSTEPEDCQGGGLEQRSAEPDDECGRGTPRSCRCTRKNLGGTRPDRLFEVRPQEGISGAPWYRLSTVRRSFHRLMFLCRRWRTSWWRCAGSSIFTSPSRLSKCPRAHLHPVILPGAVCISRSRTTEQLVEVPRIVSYSSLLGLVEQNVDLPVPHARGGRVGVRGLQGFPGQDSTAFVGAARVDSFRAVEVFKVLARDRLQVLHPRTRLVSQMRLLLVFVSHFLQKKSAKLGPHSRSELSADFTSPTPVGSAGGFLHRRRRWRVDEASVWTMDVARLGPARHPRRAPVGGRTGYMGSDMGCGCFFLVCLRRAWCRRVRLSGPHPLTQTIMGALVRLGRGPRHA